MHRQNEVAIVTGGCAGLGLATARARALVASRGRMGGRPGERCRGGTPGLGAVAIAALLALAALAGCASRPLLPYSAAIPVAMLPLSATAIEDDRARFRQAFCQVNREVGKSLPDYRPCSEALIALVDEKPGPLSPLPAATGQWDASVVMVPGLGWECVSPYAGGSDAVAYARKRGYQITMAPTEGLSGSARNARILRDYVLDAGQVPADRPVVLIGYSKGLPDILEALAQYPELTARVVAVVSLAGAVGGSPLADQASPKVLDMFRMVPGALCDDGDDGALESLKTGVRRRWLADHPLPPGIRYYAIVSHPEPQRISRGLLSSYRKLARIDARNDSQLLYYDQLLPQGKLLALLNADHFAVALPVARTHPTVGRLLLNRNGFPREVLMEALLRYLEVDLSDVMDRSPALARR